MFQFLEGVLESLPEAILQSIFIMRSYNDPDLRGSGDSTFIILLYLSIFASIISIANKYIWADSNMFEFYCQSPVTSKETMIMNIAQQFVPEYDDIGVLETSIAFVKLGYDKQTIKSFQERRVFWRDMMGHTVVKLFVDYYHKRGKLDKKQTDDQILEDLISFGTRDEEYEVTVLKTDRFDLGSAYMDDLIPFKNAYIDLLKYYLISGVSQEQKLKINELLWRIKNDDFNLHWSVNRLCKYDRYCLCLGFMIRSIWRISAVTNRFVIISSIWVVLGGAFEIIILPPMMVISYLIIALRASYKYKKHKHEIQMHEESPSNGDSLFKHWANKAMAPDDSGHQGLDCLPLPCAYFVCTMCWCVILQ